ncbi:MAG: acyl-CoA desaturase [Bacteroidota bacterium]
MARITFNNKVSPFTDTLKARIQQYFENNKLELTGNRHLFVKTIILVSSLILIYVLLVFFTPPVWISIVLCALLGVNFAAIGFNVMHDGAHGSYSGKKTINEIMAYSLNLMGGSSYIWKIKHNLIHHSFTNVEGMDDDIDIRPFMRVNEDQPRYWFHRFQHIYFLLLYGMSYFLWVYFQDFQKYFSKKIGDTPLRKMSVKDHFIFWISKLVYISVFVIIPIFKIGLADTLIGYGIAVFVCGVMIAVVFQLAHVITETSFPRPDENTSKINNEWAVHQLETTANFSTHNKFVSWLVGGLNFQVEHHLFPRISHVHYPAISKLVRDTCAEFNVVYLEHPTVISAVRSHIKHLRIMGRR